MRKSLPSRAHGFVLTLLAASALAALVAVPAQAAPSEIGRFGPGGLGSGGFREAPQGIAVEQSTGDVYVYEIDSEGEIYKFNGAGNPEEFSSLLTNVIKQVGFGTKDASEIAVDNSNGPDKGDIYVATGEAVEIYSSTGAKLATFTEEEPCGVAIDPSGEVYVAFKGGQINQYTPVTNPVKTTNYKSSLWDVTPNPCSIAV